MRYLILFSLLSFLYPCIVKGETSNAVDYLKNDSFTMFDWGMMKINSKLNSVVSEFNSIYKLTGFYFKNSSFYDEESKKIILIVNMTDSKILMNNNEKIERDTCKLMVNHIIEKFTESDHSISSHFLHYAFSEKNLPKNLQKEIENMSAIKVKQYYIKDNKRVFNLMCESQLTAKEIHFSKTNNASKSQ